KEQRNNTFLQQREKNIPAQISTDIDYYDLGRLVSSLDLCLEISLERLAKSFIIKQLNSKLRPSAITGSSDEAESVTWEAMCGKQQSLKKCADLYDRTLAIPKKEPCLLKVIPFDAFENNFRIKTIYIDYKVLDYCYGRFFLWDDESDKLWPLGNSPEEAAKLTVKGKDQLELCMSILGNGRCLLIVSINY
ncbi:5641_t:CDS:2, partial [Funneliformis geosporum]